MTSTVTTASPMVQADRPLRIGIIAPPRLTVPPVGYGGIELMIDTLARGLAGRGHQVRLFTLGESTCPVERGCLYQQPPAQIGMAIPELRHALAAYDDLASCDIIHDHTLAGVVLAARGDLPVPVVTTNHGPFNADLADLYQRVSHRVPVIAISADQASRAPVNVHIAGVIHHGVDLDRYRPAQRPPAQRYLLCLARMHPSKGVDLAIRVARQAGRRLLIAAKNREPAEHAYFEQTILPLLGNGIDYLGEIDHAAKVDLLGGAEALVNPIQWPEPFGLVMIEALACGTPVIATPNGAAPEIVTPGVNGYLATTIGELAAAVDKLDEIDSRRCRRDAVNRFSMQAMAAEHANLYHHVIRRHRHR